MGKIIDLNSSQQQACMVEPAAIRKHSKRNLGLAELIYDSYAYIAVVKLVEAAEFSEVKTIWA